jgi:hypothetical protein
LIGQRTMACERLRLTAGERPVNRRDDGQAPYQDG